MNYKFISYEKNREFWDDYIHGELDKDMYIVENAENYVVVNNLSGFYAINIFSTLKGCKKYVSKEMTAAEVIMWEQEILIRQERLIYILYYLLIFSMVLILLYLIKN